MLENTSRKLTVPFRAAKQFFLKNNAIVRVTVTTLVSFGAFVGTASSATAAKAAPITPPAPTHTTPPVDCTLHDAILPIYNKFVGNIEGLKGFGLGILLIILTVLVLVAWHRSRGSLARAGLLVAAVLIFGSAILTFVAAFIPNTCGT